MKTRVEGGDGVEMRRLGENGMERWGGGWDGVEGEMGWRVRWGGG